MKNNLATFPQEYMNIDPVWQWHYCLTQELKEQLKTIEETEEDPDYWRMASNSQIMENETRKQFIKEILGCVDKDAKVNQE